MSLSLSLGNALSGLRANQQAISVLSHNIANANTEGYSRQILDQSAAYISGQGAGVRVDDVIRKVDKYLQRAVQTQGSAVARSNVVSDYYDRVNNLLGQPGLNNTLDEYVTGFFTSIQSMVETPDRTSTRNGVAAAATRLASGVSNLAADLHDLRFEADREMRETVTSINGIINKLDNLNVAIRQAGSLGQSTAGLHDERDLALRELSGLLDISTTFGQFGDVSVIAGNGAELVGSTKHQIRYIASQSAEAFINNSSMNAVEVINLDANGNQIGAGLTLISAGTTGNITSTLTGGKLEGLRLVRDDVLPAMLSQLDQLAANVRDAVNAVHNDGSGFPPAASLTGTRGFTASQQTSWQGAVRVAVLRKDGTPIPAGYADEAYTGLRPLTLDLTALTARNGGAVSMQTIVNEINQHFGAPVNKAQLGNLNSIKLVSKSDSLALGVASNFNFDFEIENISGESTDFFMGGVTVRDASGVDITNVTTPPVNQIMLNTATTYYTTAGLPDVTIDLPPGHGVQAGDLIYLSVPGTADVNGIPAADISGYFEVVNVGGNSVTFIARSPAATTGNVADASGVYVQTAATQNAASGQTVRTGNVGLDLSGNPNSAYYDITVAIATFDADGNMQTSNITYRVNNGHTGLNGDRYGAISADGDGSVELPTTSQETMRAILVDANGVEIARQPNGEYFDRQPSFLKLVSNNTEYTVAIDEMNSQELGDPDAVPQTVTNRGFSHYFELNNFFASNNPTANGDTLANSALNLRVEQRLIDNPNLITSGEMVLQRQPTASGEPPQYTYRRYAGDNQLATRLVNIANQTLQFDAAGGLPAISLTLGGYTSEFLGFIASSASASDDEAANAQVLYDGFKTRSDAVTGVNLDEELANTVIFQNSYAATARIISVVDKMMEDLLQML